MKPNDVAELSLKLITMQTHEADTLDNLMVCLLELQEYTVGWELLRMALTGTNDVYRIACFGRGMSEIRRAYVGSERQFTELKHWRDVYHLLLDDVVDLVTMPILKRWWVAFETEMLSYEGDRLTAQYILEF